MSDQKEDNVIEDTYQVDSDKESSNVRYHGGVTRHVIQNNLEDCGSSQFVNLKDGNEAVADSIEALEVCQSNEIGKEGSLMPHESVQAPVNELPRNNEQKENSTSTTPSRPSKRRYRRRSTSRISINAQAAEDGGLRRSSRIKERNDANNVNHHDPYEDPYLFKKRPLYMEMKKDVYAYPGYDSEFEDDEWH